MSLLFKNILNNKKIKRFFNLFVYSSLATFENPSIGPNLSPYMPRDKIKLFCEELNNKSRMLKSGLKILVRLYLCTDKSFFFIIKGVPFSLLLKLLLNLKFNQFIKTSKSITIYEAFDLLYITNIYNNKYLSYDNLLLKNQLVNNIYSIKNLIVTK